MTVTDDATLLTIGRIIRAPRPLVWSAWAEPDSLAKWWLPAPYACRVLTLDLKPGGGFVTEMSEDGQTWQPHLDACVLDAIPGEMIAFTTALVGGWRPADDPFITLSAIMTFRDHSEGTDYQARVFHRNPTDRAKHEEMGFFEGWGTCIAQLAKLVEARVQ